MLEVMRGNEENICKKFGYDDKMVSYANKNFVYSTLSEIPPLANKRKRMIDYEEKYSINNIL